jgi:hypothetical protein
LLTFVISVTQSGTALTANCVNFVDKDNAQGTFVGFVEEMADTTRADSDEHFDEFGSRDPEKGHASFTGDCPRQQRFACSGRADQQHATRDAAAEFDELLGFLQDFDDFLEFLERFVDTSHVNERHARQGPVRDLCSGLTERLHRIFRRGCQAGAEAAIRPRRTSRVEPGPPARPTRTVAAP